MHNRRHFVAHAVSAITAPYIVRGAFAAEEGGEPIAETASGKVRGVTVGGVRVFKGIPYGADTSGDNRFMLAKPPKPWTGVRDALAYGPTAPQTVGGGRGNGPAESEDCLVLNIFTPSLETSARKPVMVWLHGGGFSTGSGSGATIDGTNLARSGDVVVVSINHRLNILGFTDLVEFGGSDFAAASSVGLTDIVAALQWVRVNISRFGGNPNLVTIFGQSGGGRKVATLMSMPSAQGLYHRAIIESGAILRLTRREDALQYTRFLFDELGLTTSQLRELQNVPLQKLLAANEAALKRTDQTAPGYTANSPMVDGRIIPANPWDPAGPAISAKIPLMIGWARTEETLYDRPTPEKLALDDAGLRERTAKRLGVDPGPIVDTYRKAHPEASPWDLYILIATDHPRGLYARELARRKAEQKAAPVWLYRFDWETPEGGGHMRSPHTIEIPFVFNTIKVAGPLISKMPEAQVLADKVSAAWAAFARNGNPAAPGLPKWPAYSAAARDTMLFNNESRVERDPDSGPRQAMERVLNVA